MVVRRDCVHGGGREIRADGHAGARVLVERAFDRIDVAPGKPLRRPRQQHQPAGILDRQALQRDGIDEGEDGGVGADAQGERDDGGSRDARRVAQQSGRIAEVADHLVQEGQAAFASAVVLPAVHGAELEARLPLRHPARHAAPLQVVGPGLQVEAQLGVHVRLEPGAAEDAAEEDREARKHHASPRRAPSAAVIAAVSRSQPSDSSRRRFRPEGVSV